MIIEAENVAKEFQISRQEQDEFTLNSQLKTKIAQENGFFEKVKTIFVYRLKLK